MKNAEKDKVFFLFFFLKDTSVMQLTWYLLVELKGISATFLFLSLIDLTAPQDSSMHFSRADSEASPATSRFRMGSASCPALNWARLHRPATRARASHVTELLSKEAPARADMRKRKGRRRHEPTCVSDNHPGLQRISHDRVLPPAHSPD